jgi:hypothetical protein
MTTRTSSRTRPGLLVAGILLTLTAAACTGGAAPTPAASPTSAPPSTEPASSPAPSGSAEPSREILPVESPSTVPTDGVPPVLVEAAIADAAARAGVDPTTVTVVSADAVTWPNGAAGCPKPGMMYTDALVPGYRVVLEAGGTTYDYRGSQRGGDLGWCENPAPPGPGAAG